MFQNDFQLDTPCISCLLSKKCFLKAMKISFSFFNTGCFQPFFSYLSNKKLWSANSITNENWWSVIFERFCLALAQILWKCTFHNFIANCIEFVLTQLYDKMKLKHSWQLLCPWSSKSLSNRRRDGAQNLNQSSGKIGKNYYDFVCTILSIKAILLKRCVINPKWMMLWVSTSIANRRIGWSTKKV